MKQQTDQKANFALEHLKKEIGCIMRAEGKSLPSQGDVRGEYDLIYPYLVAQGMPVLDMDLWSLDSPNIRELPRDWKRAFTMALKTRRKELLAMLEKESPIGK